MRPIPTKALSSIVVSAALSLFFVSVASAASFPCEKAKSKVEKAICSDAELNSLDQQLAGAYKKALANYPLPDYVRTRQREWLSNNTNCDPKDFAACLKKNYKDRILQLATPANIQIYANSTNFDYEGGDAIVEIIPSSLGHSRINIWGGYRIHMLNSKENGKSIYNGCDFEGLETAVGTYHGASHENGDYIGDLHVQITGNKLQFEKDSSDKICGGFGSLPDEFFKIR